jgi:HPt (histidine-containing phosphotransfer) domain-containing protein
MTNALGRPFLDTSAIDDDVWNRRTFDKLMDLIGARMASNIATRFRSDLRDRFVDVTSRERVRRDAHAVTSTSELLGFAKLSHAARRLETACETGEGFDASVLALMIAKVNALNALSDYMAPEQSAV